MDYQDAIKIMNRLSEVKKNSDIYGRATASLGGTSCPLRGIMNAAVVQDLAIIAVGMPECLWYQKNYENYLCPENTEGRYFSLILEEADIAMGFREELVKNLVEVHRRTSARGIILASTCIPEIIGEDFEAAAKLAEAVINVPVIVIPTSHFDDKCYGPPVVDSRLMLAMARFMEEQETVDNMVNLIGIDFLDMTANQKSFKDNELVSILKKYGFEINYSLLRRSTTDDIRKSPAARLNILISDLGKELADYMKDEFDIPYVKFYRSCELEEVESAYCEIEKVLGIKIEEKDSLKENALNSIEAARLLAKNKTVVCAGTGIVEALFLIYLGMKVKLINCFRLDERLIEAARKILEANCNPFINYIGNQHLVDAYLSKEVPDLYIGVNASKTVKEMDTAKIEWLISGSKLGFETAAFVADRVRAAFLEYGGERL